MCLKVWSPPSVVAEWWRGTVVPLISTLAPYRSAMDLSWLYQLGLILLARSRVARWLTCAGLLLSWEGERGWCTQILITCPGLQGTLCPCSLFMIRVGRPWNPLLLLMGPRSSSLMTPWVPGSLASCCLFLVIVLGRCNRQGPIKKSPSEGETLPIQLSYGANWERLAFVLSLLGVTKELGAYFSQQDHLCSASAKIKRFFFSRAVKSAMGAEQSTLGHWNTTMCPTGFSLMILTLYSRL